MLIIPGEMIVSSAEEQNSKEQTLSEINAVNSRLSQASKKFEEILEFQWFLVAIMLLILGFVFYFLYQKIKTIYRSQLLKTRIKIRGKGQNTHHNQRRRRLKPW